MNTAIFQRAVILAVCLTSAALAGPAQAAPESIKVSLTGTQEVPPVQTPGTGKAEITYDSSTRVVTWTITYSGLLGAATMAEFHGPADEGEIGPVVVWIWLSKQGSPAGSPTSGQATLTPELAQQFAAGEWYVNVHTQAHPTGEIRGQVKPPKS